MALGAMTESTNVHGSRNLGIVNIRERVRLGKATEGAFVRDLQYTKRRNLSTPTPSSGSCGSMMDSLRCKDLVFNGMQSHICSSPMERKEGKIA